MRSRALGPLLICVSATLWGLDGVVLTPRLHNLPVPFVVFLLHAVPFLLMQPFLAGGGYRRMAAMRWQGWLSLLLVALTGGLLGTMAIVKALFLVNFSQLSVVVLLQKLQPVFAIVLAALLLGERMTARFLGWAAAAVLGAYLLTFGARLPGLGSGAPTLHAAAWALLAAACFGSATVLGKQLLGTLDFRYATFARYGVTSVLALAYCAASGTGLPFGGMTAQNWLLVVLIGVTTGSGAIFLYYRGLALVRASVSAICELCLPLSAVIFDYLINDSTLGVWQWIGAALMVGAIVRVTRPQATPSES